MNNTKTFNSQSAVIQKEDIVGVECRHVFYLPPPNNDKRRDDFHLSKEIIHTKDGRRVPHVRLWKNFKRRFWVAREGFRKYQQKKEWEDIRKLQEFKARQCDLQDACARALGKQAYRGSMRRLQNDPHLYGTDILSTSVIKQEIYRDRFPDLNTPSTLAVCDTETDMINGTEQVIMTTITYRDKAFTAITKDFLKRHGNAVQKIQELAMVHIAETMKARGIKWEIVVVESDVDSIYECIMKAHEWKPDFLTFWNVDFDMTKIMEAFERRNINPADVFCDPIVPREYRYFEYIRGASQKVTASGKVTPIKPAARWHTVDCPASFYIVDAMCAFRQIRTGQPERQSYALDAILKAELDGKIQKLKFEEANHVKGAEWHIFMQRHFELEYVVYNLFDCICVELLDEKTKDLCTAMPSAAAMSDYRKFNSQPRRTCDKLHYFVLQRGKVMGTTGETMEHEYDKLTIGLKDWIVMLPAHQVADNGLRIIKDAPHLATNIRLHVGDLDVSASYPYGEAVFNISRETTHLELIDIEGVSEFDRRMQGINLSSGATNAVEFCTTLFGLPTPAQWLDAFQADMAADQHIEGGLELREITSTPMYTPAQHCEIPFEIGGSHQDTNLETNGSSGAEEEEENDTVLEL